MPSKSIERKNEEMNVDVPAFVFMKGRESGTEDYREIFCKEMELERTPCLVVTL